MYVCISLPPHPTFQNFLVAYKPDLIVLNSSAGVASTSLQKMLESSLIKEVELEIGHKREERREYYHADEDDSDEFKPRVSECVLLIWFSYIVLFFTRE